MAAAENSKKAPRFSQKYSPPPIWIVFPLFHQILLHQLVHEKPQIPFVSRDRHRTDRSMSCNPSNMKHLELELQFRDAVLKLQEELRGDISQLVSRRFNPINSRIESDDYLEYMGSEVRASLFFDLPRGCLIMISGEKKMENVIIGWLKASYPFGGLLHDLAMSQSLVTHRSIFETDTLKSAQLRPWMVFQPYGMLVAALLTLTVSGFI
jgi:hypothetical protein